MTDKRTHTSDCEWHIDQYPWECTCGAIPKKKAMDDLIAQDADLIEFMASDAACYLYPDEGQKAERAAYTRGCAEQAAELAKFKALAETLARALARCGRIVERHNWRQSEKVDDVKRIVAETLLQYKEATQ